MTRMPLLALLASVTLSACDKADQDLIRTPDTPPQSVLIRNTAVFDPASGERRTGLDVHIRGEHIVAISPTGQSPTRDAQLIDGSGATLLPGLIDMHSHVCFSSAPRWQPELPDPPRNLRAYLYSGVTTVLDIGGMDNQIFDLRARTASGTLPGPRIYAAGPIVTTTGGHPVAVLDKFAPWWIRWYIKKHQTREVASTDQARATVAEIAGMGADVIKLAVDRIPEATPRITREVLAAAVSEARARNLRAVAHIGSVSDAIDAAEAGVSLWVHGVYKERIADEQIPQLARFGIPMIPTMAVFENYALLGREPRRATALERETVPATTLAAFDAVPGEDPDTAFFRPYLEMLYEQRLNWRDNVRRLHRAGVTILAGSDMQAGVFPGAGLHRELDLLVEAGLSPAEALRAATLDPARYLSQREDPPFGLVAEGKIADLLLVEGDPTQGLQALSRIRAVIKGGLPMQRSPVAAGG